jgi:hypothetical protein
MTNQNRAIKIKIDLIGIRSVMKRSKKSQIGFL